MVIYKITNKISGKSYIGQTVQELSRRVRFHTKRNIKSCISSAIQKYGMSNFTVEVIGGANSRAELNYLEEHYIHIHNCIAPYGYNIKKGGNNHAGKKMSQEHKDKIYKANKGRIHSKEIRERMSQAKMGHSHNRGKMPNSIKIVATNIETNESIIFNSLSDAARHIYGKTTCPTNISNTLRGKHKQCMGWTFKYHE